jgi:hypothetical protein
MGGLSLSVIWSPEGHLQGIAERFEGDAQYEQYEQLNEELPQYSRSLATMRVAYEYLSSMSIIVQRNTNFVQQWWRALLAPCHIEDRLLFCKTLTDHLEAREVHGLDC